MPRFFIRSTQVDGERIALCGDDAHHIARSLRMAVGDGLTVCDMQGREYDCIIESFDEDREVSVKVVSVKEASNEPRCYVRLFQALPKGDKLDTVIQKAVECGACEIVPFESERCVVKIKPDAEARKTERRNRIALEAAKQCGRSALPEVKGSVSFERMLELISEDDLCLFCYEGDGTRRLGDVLKENEALLMGNPNAKVSVVIGSEGGFSIAESEKIRSAGAVAVGLGRRILRTETASGFVLSCLVYATELGGLG